MDVPANARTLACADGFVKCFLYIMEPAYLYWRVAVSEVNVATESDGWLYAHLIKETVPVKVGDQVKRGQHLGDIVKWDALSTSGSNRGHIHFSRIRDKGMAWKYDDGQWKNVCDPVTKLRPYGDQSAPKFLEGETGSLFLYSTNDGNGTPTYMKPSELKGSIDIVVKMTDVIGPSKWDQPAFSIHYWINDANGKTVLPRQIGIVRDWVMPDYSGDLYYSLPPVMYRMDAKCPMKSSWTESNRCFYHVITNNDNDSMITLDDKKQALDTRRFSDGSYWIVVEMADAAGNTAIDSQKVVFKNGITGIADSQGKTEAISPRIVQTMTKSYVLQLPASARGTALVHVFNAAGKQIISKSVNVADYSSVNQIPVEMTLAHGFYTVSISVNGHSWNHQLISK